MQVNATVREQALLRMLQRHFAGSDGEIALVELEQVWHETGLRQSDLRRGIDDLARDGCWAVTGEGMETRLQLLPEGLERLRREPASVEELSRQVVARANLFRAARRRRSARPGRNRRDDDHRPVG